MNVVIGLIDQNELKNCELSKNERGARQSSSLLERSIVCLGNSPMVKQNYQMNIFCPQQTD